MGSQVRQEIIERLDTAYNRFFRRVAQRPPKFKKSADFVSIVYKQAGYKINGNELILNKKFRFKFSKSRDFEGTIKRMIVKRSRVNEYYVVIVTDAKPKEYRKTHNGASVGIDFGLKTYLTMSDGSEYDNPLFLKQHIAEIRQKSRNLSKCKKGSNNRKKKRLELARLHEKLHDKREDYQFKLAHQLCRKYDYIFIDTPPVNVVADTTAISNLCDGILFVVRYKYTTHDMLYKAISSVEFVNAKILGFLLNDVDLANYTYSAKSKYGRYSYKSYYYYNNYYYYY